MALSKNGVNGVGAAACAALIVVGGLFIAKPQFGAASEYSADKTEAAGSRSMQEAKLANLKAQQPNLAALQAEYDETSAGIPDSEDIASIGRVIVEKLPDGVVLSSFSHQVIAPYAAPTAPVITLGEPPSPAVEATEEAAAPAGEPSGPPVLQQIHLTITVSAETKADLAKYLDALATGPRLLFVYLVQANPSTDTSEDVNPDATETTIYAYAYANAPAVPAPAAPAAGEEAAPAE